MSDDITELIRLNNENAALHIDNAALRAKSAQQEQRIAFLERIVTQMIHTAYNAPATNSAPQALECGDSAPLSLLALRSLVDCPPLTKAQKQAFNNLAADDWTVEDWADLYNSMECVIIRVCNRHGITVPRGTNPQPKS